MPIPRTTCGNKCGIRGVHWYRGRLYRVRIVVQNEIIHLGDTAAWDQAVVLRHAGEMKYRPGLPLSEVKRPEGI